MSDGVKKQKEWIEKLDVAFRGDPIYVTKNWRQGNAMKPGKQFMVNQGSIEKLPPYDHRTVNSQEIVFDLDAPSYATNRKYGKVLCEYLVAQGIPHYTFWSGNKSLHIHIFFDIDIKSPELIEKVSKVEIDLFQALRIKIAKTIIEESGVNPKVVDMDKIKWARPTLIRICGGGNFKYDDFDKMIGSYKTFIPLLPAKVPKPATFDDVVYPEKVIKKYIVNEDILAQIIKEQETAPEIKREPIIDYKGKFVNLPCVLKALEGMSVGERGFGAQIIATAARLDGYDLMKATQLLQGYVDSCTQLPKFSIDEAKGWAKWIYKVPNPYWACGNCVKRGVCYKEDCSLHKERYKEELAIFEQGEPLTLIKEALDALIVGEDELKMQLFLLYLTKNFSHEYFLLLDGPASSGKTHVMKAVARLFGEEDEEFFVFSRMTGAVLNHSEEIMKTWNNKLVLIEELQGAKNVIEQLRVLISEGVCKLLVTEEVKGEDGVKHNTGMIKTTKTSALFVTCNAESFEDGDQMQSRAWVLNTDQSKQQTRKIMKSTLTKFKGVTKEYNLEPIQRGLKFLDVPADVVFPYAEELMEYMSDSSVRARRDCKKIITLVKASAYFHQKNRYSYNNILIADWRDVEIVFKWCGESFKASTQGIGSRDMDRFRLIEYKVQQMNIHCDPHFFTFNMRDVIGWFKCSMATAKKSMSSLCQAGFVENSRMQPNPAVYSLTGMKPEWTADILKICKQKISEQDDKIKEWIENEK